jgi:hypothetical protein
MAKELQKAYDLGYEALSKKFPAQLSNDQMKERNQLAIAEANGDAVKVADVSGHDTYCESLFILRFCLFFMLLFR